MPRPGSARGSGGLNGGGWVRALETGLAVSVSGGVTAGSTGAGAAALRRRGSRTGAGAAGVSARTTGLAGVGGDNGGVGAAPRGSGRGGNGGRLGTTVA